MPALQKYTIDPGGATVRITGLRSKQVPAGPSLWLDSRSTRLCRTNLWVGSCPGVDSALKSLTWSLRCCSGEAGVQLLAFQGLKERCCSQQIPSDQAQREKQSPL
jgi:hypothetical protein